MTKYICDICGRTVSGYGIKFVLDGQICRKGICRRIYDKWHDMINAKASFKNGLESGEIQVIDRKDYGGLYYKYIEVNKGDAK